MKIPFLYEYKWDKLEQAYGSAENAPSSILGLISENKDIRNEAIYDFLHSQACHQYTTYSCTPPTVRCVIYILRHHTIEDVGSLCEILSFIAACSYNAKKIETLRNEILEGFSCYQFFCNHENERVKNEAQSLVDFCMGHDVNGS